MVTTRAHAALIGKLAVTFDIQKIADFEVRHSPFVLNLTFDILKKWRNLRISRNIETLNYCFILSYVWWTVAYVLMGVVTVKPQTKSRNETRMYGCPYSLITLCSRVSGQCLMLNLYFDLKYLYLVFNLFFRPIRF